MDMPQRRCVIFGRDLRLDSDSGKRPDMHVIESGVSDGVRPTHSTP